MRKFLFTIPILTSLLALGAESSNKISVITIDDKIVNPIAAEYIEKAIQEAEEEKHQALVIELDTPGGLLSSTRMIVKRILNAQVPVVVYVSPRGARAGSAGVFITLAAHVAAMAPSTNIGAAHPVEFGESPRQEKESFWDLLKSFKKDDKKKEEKKSPPPEAENPMSDKILNDTVAWVSTIARTRGRNVEWAIRAVKESISSGESEALKLGVVDLVSSDLKELLKELNGREVMLASGSKVRLQTEGVTAVRVPMSLRQQILDVLINPNIAYILMILGFYGLLFEITHPGVWFPGVAGLICIILAFYAFHSLPTNYAGLALILLAMGLFVAEVFVTSYGLLSLVGIVSMLLGSLFLFDASADFMRVSLQVVIPIVASTALIFFFLVSLAIRAQRRKSPVGAEGMVGQKGEAAEGGKVYVAGELWNSTANGEVRKGDRIEVIGVDGMRLRVRKG